MLLLALALAPAPVVAQCSPNDDACLEQRGDNSSRTNVDIEGQGGDAIAGSQVISVTGGGNTNITANNQSRFARARGGDVKANVQTTVDNGPRVQVTRPSTSAEATATGIAQTTQSATPNVSVTLDQTALPMGATLLANTASSANFITGTNAPSVIPGAGPVVQDIQQVLNAPLNQNVVPIVNLVADNTAVVTGSTPLSQSATSRASPTALAFGGSASANATAVVPVAQSASPQVSLSLGQIAAPDGLSVISNEVSSEATLEATNEGGTIQQTLDAPVANTFAPQTSTVAANTATITGSAPVDQLATAQAAPTATAMGLGPPVVRGTLLHIGDNDTEVETSMAFIGGDAVAGSNVIGVAGGGNTTIFATNDSMFARADGGDVESVVVNVIDSGPRLTVFGASALAIADATGVAADTQTAVPVGIATLGQLAQAQLGTFGVNASNAAALSFVTGVGQTAGTQSDPVATAIGGGGGP